MGVFAVYLETKEGYKLINILVNKKYSVSVTDGYSHMLQSELQAIIIQKGYQVRATEECADYSANVIILVAQYSHEVRGKWISHVCNDADSNCLIIVCGRMATLDWEYLLTNNQRLDCVVLGEPFEAIPELIKHVVDGADRDLSNIYGIAYLDKDTHKPVKTDFRHAMKDYDSLPISKPEYIKDIQPMNRTYYLETSYECYGRCNFCAGHLYRKANPCRYSCKSIDRIIAEIKFITNNYGVRIFNFYDENFFMDGKTGVLRAYNLAKKIIDERLHIRFTIEARASDIDIEIIDILKKAGLYMVFLGVESGAQTVLDRYCKETTVDQNVNAMKILSLRNVKCYPGYILFDPITTDAELLQTTQLFLEFSDNLYSYQLSNDSSLLYFPKGCAFLTKMIQQGIYINEYDVDSNNYPFIDEKIARIHKKYLSEVYNCELEPKDYMKSRMTLLEKIILDI
jgi:radical SAM superfamily enzyme YgiQ (UPF0313 family)